MGIDIIENAKTQRIGVCNAMETLLVHKNVEDEFYNKLQALIEDKDMVNHYEIEQYDWNHSIQQYEELLHTL